MTIGRWRTVPADAFALLLCLGYAFFVASLAIRQHDSFHTHAFDMGYLDNVVWNTSQGRLFANDLPDKPHNFLGDHFSPAIIALVPFYWVWSDARMLLAVQAGMLALSVAPAYWLVRQRSAWLGLLAMLALYLNPALLDIGLGEFHEIALGAPLLALAAYLLATRRHRAILVVVALGALAVKEELAVAVAGIGLHLLAEVVFWRRVSGNTRESDTSAGFSRMATGCLGVFLIIIAVVWLTFVWGILPGLLAESVSHWQERYGDIAPTPVQGLGRLLSDPQFLFSRFAVPAKWQAILRVLWPFAFLPLLSPALFALALPVCAYLLLSSKASVSQLQFWYVTPVLPFLFIASAQTIRWAQARLAYVYGAALLLGSAAAYLFLGSGPLAAAYEPVRFGVTDRTECGARLLTAVPPQAAVSAQDNLAPHLSHRTVLHVFPSLGDPPDGYVAIDSRFEFVAGHSNWPAVRPLDVPAEVNNFLSKPSYALVGDACDYKLLRYTGPPVIARPKTVAFGRQIQLMGFEIAVKDAYGLYAPTTLSSRPGDDVRVTLWWQALGRPAQDYTVFVHALDGGGQLAGQHDSPPANGYRPTSGWLDGEIVKDIHYFSVVKSVVNIAVGLYDSKTGQRLSTDGGGDSVLLTAQ